MQMNNRSNRIQQYELPGGVIVVGREKKRPVKVLPVMFLFEILVSRGRCVFCTSWCGFIAMVVLTPAGLCTRVSFKPRYSQTFVMFWREFFTALSQWIYTLKKQTSSSSSSKSPLSSFPQGIGQMYICISPILSRILSQHPSQVWNPSDLVDQWTSLPCVEFPQPSPITWMFLGLQSLGGYVHPVSCDYVLKVSCKVKEG